MAAAARHGQVDALQAEGEATRGDRLAAAQRAHQVVVAAATAHLQRALVAVDVDLEDQPCVVAQAARQAEVDLNLERSGSGP